MSESIYIEPARVPRYDEVLAQLDEFSGLQVTSSTEIALDQDGSWPNGSLQFYRHGISTRPVEVHFLQGRFQVRTLALTAPEDLALSTRIINVLATASRGVIKTENGEAMSRLDETNTIEVGRRIFASDAEAAAAQIEVRGAQEVGISGPLQDFYLGPRSLKKLRSSGNFADHLLKAMRRVQYIDRTQYREANVFQVQYADGHVDSVSVWEPGPAFLFKGVDWLSLPTEVDAEKPDLLGIPFATLPELAGDRFAWLDEKQSVVQPYNDREWPDVVQRAKRLTASPTPRRSADEPKKKRWWQF